jgi:hypothetical protein
MEIRSNATGKGTPMISFTFSVDQVKSAPAEVRRWIERETARRSPC